MLRAGPESLGEIAGRIGYEAEAAFSKAFKRWAGHAPGAYRQSARTTAASSVG
jgi:AraC-like DNA-binding protein